jgi:hypothetical protein
MGNIQFIGAFGHAIDGKYHLSGSHAVCTISV